MIHPCYLKCVARFLEPLLIPDATLDSSYPLPPLDLSGDAEEYTSAFTQLRWVTILEYLGYRYTGLV